MPKLLKLSTLLLSLYYMVGSVVQVFLALYLARNQASTCSTC